jgi:hypothetical protein
MWYFGYKNYYLIIFIYIYIYKVFNYFKYLIIFKYVYIVFNYFKYFFQTNAGNGWLHRC